MESKGCADSVTSRNVDSIGIEQAATPLHHGQELRCVMAVPRDFLGIMRIIRITRIWTVYLTESFQDPEEFRLWHGCSPLSLVDFIGRLNSKRK